MREVRESKILFWKKRSHGPSPPPEICSSHIPQSKLFLEESHPILAWRSFIAGFIPNKRQRRSIVRLSCSLVIVPEITITHTISKLPSPNIFKIHGRRANSTLACDCRGKNRRVKHQLDVARKKSGHRTVPYRPVGTTGTNCGSLSRREVKTAQTVGKFDCNFAITYPPSNDT